jgi:hypothetical protein
VKHRFVAWLVWRLIPERLHRLFVLEQRLDDVYRWCGEFDQMCDAVDWICTGKQDIAVWREQMRKKYGQGSH